MKTMPLAEVERCAQACHECLDECLQLLPHCLDLGGKHAAGEHINTLLDCVAVTTACHNLLHRRSMNHAEVCRACARICAACAKDCLRIGAGDRHMERCAEACQRCEDLCKQMS